MNESNNVRLDRLRQQSKELPAAIFMVHRRVMTDLYKEYDLNGYEIEFLLLVLHLGDFTLDAVVKGSDIRKKISRRFANVVRGISDKLIYRGYISDLNAEQPRKYMRLQIREKSIEFGDSFFLSLNKQLASDGVDLILNARFRWEKKKE